MYYWAYLLKNEQNLFDNFYIFIVDGNCKKREQRKTVLHTMNENLFCFI